MECPSCGSRDIEFHDAGGDAVCVSCGTVCEESVIVSSIEFSETGGSASVVGQFVSENCSKPYSGAMHASARSRYGFCRNSRETTLAKGRASISEVAGRLRLQNHYIESAHRLFAFAVQRNFVQGRKTMHVVAVCLYVKCREDKSPHMLIDFSDALSVNVFTLGSCFLKFCRLLNIETSLIDPSLYIHRFAGRLDLGTQTSTVAQAALRIVARMKRDWIITGRRPAGICAAALLIAARTYGFPRTQAEIVKVLRVCGMTVRTRLEEFEATPAAQLTMEGLRSAEMEAPPALEQEQDPPSFSKGRVRVPPTLLLTGGDEAASSSSLIVAPLVVEGRQLKRKPSQSSQRRVRERETLFRDVEEQLQFDDQESALAPLSVTPAQATEHEEDSDDSLDDEDLSGFVLSAEEAAKKGAIWSEMNKVFLEERAVKEKRAAEELKQQGDGKGAAKKKKRQYTKSSVQSTAEEAFEQTLVSKKISKKINYAALEGIFGPQSNEITAAHHTARVTQRRRHTPMPPPPARIPPLSSQTSARAIASEDVTEVVEEALEEVHVNAAVEVAESHEKLQAKERDDEDDDEDEEGANGDEELDYGGAGGDEYENEGDW
jgi:transcription factor IIIB subunit 2